MKTILSTSAAPTRHWVGNGFPVHGMFDYRAGAEERSPFLLLDYGSPFEFEPGNERRGVGQHPHRGFETVTIVYEGEVEHRDSTGNGGVIGRGDVQWMTAGGGILHEEFHTERFTTTGGPFEMAQLWVNLPAKDKMTAPGYQAITDAQIPQVTLAHDAGLVRVIAGEFAGTKGPASTFSPMNVLDVRLTAGAAVDLPQPQGWSTIVVVMSGTVQINGEQVLRAKEMATLSRTGTDVHIEANGDVKLLLLSGLPLDEPIEGHGPFVMNTKAEIIEAMRDFNAGKFGSMT